MSPLLEVAIRGEHDAAGAQEGGAGRMLLAGPDRRSPNLESASAVLRGSDVPIRVVLRLNDSYTTTGGEFTRLIGLAEEYLALGAEGVAFGFLDADLGVDVDTCRALADALPGVPWTFHEAVDACLDVRQAWRALSHLPGLDAVLTAGSPQGLGVGYDDLLATARADEGAARLILPGEGLLPEHVPWLARAGVGQFHVGVQTRPGASYKSYVDPGYVRSWRLLLDS